MNKARKKCKVVNCERLQGTYVKFSYYISETTATGGGSDLQLKKTKIK